MALFKVIAEVLGGGFRDFNGRDGAPGQLSRSFRVLKNTPVVGLHRSTRSGAKPDCLAAHPEGHFASTGW